MGSCGLPLWGLAVRIVSPALFVVARTGTNLGTKDILNHCRGHLSSYKVPFSVHFVDEIPRTGSGKIIRFKLRETLVTSVNKAS
ncbi:AMP-binding enzyme [Afipia sp. DC4300-2b1]|uniref:AMP-binding enzyme n=1 Tax=Afipia sp. DC4300-2b1 TaxID=2804672 RepID=UPI003CF93977